MSLAPGTRVGTYEIAALIGRGGMGEVYRARDLKLGREVAVKILPDVFARDPDRLARFEREAKVLAALNHPHIAAIYGFEEGAPSASLAGPIRALALELVEGPTLADRISQGAVPLDEALAVAAQIVDALDAAHSQGIVHRDLKPANIKLRPDGTVKVLDFGLAKSLESHPADIAHSPTITAVSQSGVILGTAAYMSPEQARGRDVDKRTDIWAFGCVLYELLTGTAVFAADTTTDTLSAIVSQSPDWNRLPKRTPSHVRTLLEHTLEKDVRKRLRDIGDARLFLHGAAPPADIGAVPAIARSLRTWRLLTVATAVAALLLAVGLWRVTRRPPDPPAPAQLTRLTADVGFTTDPSISADGRLVAYASDRAGAGNLDVWVQQTAGGGAVRLTTDPTAEWQSNISPDGTRIAFRSERSGGGVYVVPALGGDARLIAPEGRMPKFSPDGRSVAYWTGGWLAARGVANVRRTFIVDANGGAPRQVAQQLASSGDPVWSPDGTLLLVYGRQTTSGPDTAADWWLVPADSGAPRRTNAYQSFAKADFDVTTVDVHPYPSAWTATGVLFAATTRETDVRRIWRLDLDVHTGKVVGAPRPLTLGTTSDYGPTGSQDGRVLFAGLTRERLILGLPLDANAGRPTGDVKVLRTDLAEVSRSTASSDGNLIAFPRFDGDSASVWVRDLRTGRDRQIVSTRRTPLNPVISDDGQWVGYTVSARDQGGQSGAGAGFVSSVDGGSPRKVCDDCEIYQWLHGNRYVVALQRPALQLVEVASGRAIDVLTVIPKSGEPLRNARVTGGALGRPSVSPDERFISFQYQNKTHVAPFSGPRLISDKDWRVVFTFTQPSERTCGWSPDSRLLYFLLERDGFRCLYALRLDPRTGLPVGEVFPVQHFHDPSRQWGSTGFSSAVVQGLFLFNQVGLSGNIWQLRQLDELTRD